MGSARTHYEILGLEKSATQDEIKTAYRRLSRSVHPDLANGNNALFGMVSEAYEVLRDPARRAAYDSSQDAPEPGPPPAPEPATQQSWGGTEESAKSGAGSRGPRATTEDRWHRGEPEPQVRYVFVSDEELHRQRMYQDFLESSAHRRALYAGPPAGYDPQGRRRSWLARTFRPYAGWPDDNEKVNVWAWPLVYLVVSAGILLRQSPIGAAWFPNPDLVAKEAERLKRFPDTVIPPFQQGWDYGNALGLGLLFAPAAIGIFLWRKKLGRTPRTEKVLLLAALGAAAFAGEDLIFLPPLEQLLAPLTIAYALWLVAMWRWGGTAPMSWLEMNSFPAWWEGCAERADGFLEKAFLRAGVHLRRAVLWLPRRVAAVARRPRRAKPGESLAHP